MFSTLGTGDSCAAKATEAVAKRRVRNCILAKGATGILCVEQRVGSLTGRDGWRNLSGRRTMVLQIDGSLERKPGAASKRWQRVVPLCPRHAVKVKTGGLMDPSSRTSECGSSVSTVLPKRTHPDILNARIRSLKERRGGGRPLS